MKTNEADEKNIKSKDGKDEEQNETQELTVEVSGGLIRSEPPIDFN